MCGIWMCVVKIHELDYSVSFFSIFRGWDEVRWRGKARGEARWPYYFTYIKGWCLINQYCMVILFKICTNIYVHVCLCMYMHACTYMCVCMLVWMCICIQALIYVYINEDVVIITQRHNFPTSDKRIKYQNLVWKNFLIDPRTFQNLLIYIG